MNKVSNQDSVQNLNISNDELSIKDYLFLLRIYWKIIAFITVTSLLITIYYTYSVERSYRSKATLMIREKTGKSMIMDFGGSRQKNLIINEIQLIRSRTVAKSVIEKLWNSDQRNNLHIFDTKIYRPSGYVQREFLKRFFSFGLYEPSSKRVKNHTDSYTNKIGEEYCSRITENLKVSNRKNTDILELSFDSPFPDESRFIVNTIADVYLSTDKKWGAEQAESIVSFLESQVKIQTKKLEVAENNLRSFKEERLIFDLDGNADLVLQRLVDAETKYYNSIAQSNILIEKSNFFKSKLTEDENTLASKLLNDLNIQVNSIRSSITVLESQLIKNQTQYGSDHEAVLKTKRKISKFKEELNDKIKLLVSEQSMTVADPLKYRQEIIAELLTAEAENSNLNSQISEYKKLVELYTKELNNLPSKQIEFARLERDNKVLEQTYTFMKQKLEEAKINVASNTGKIQIIDYAVKSKKPFKPIPSNNIIIGLILGLSIGVGFVLLIEFLDNTVKSADDIKKMNLVVLGIIPSIGDQNINKILSAFNIQKSKTPSASVSRKLKRRLITREDPKSPVSESYRSLRTNMMYSSTDKEIKSVLVSSSGPGEGKTTTVANLAITYANLGKKTLLIDTDLRRPVIHKVFDCDRDNGITSYLSGVEKDFKKLIQNTPIDNLSVVTSGIIPPNPSELLGSERMTNLIAKLESEWDMILFDSPPLVAVTDATMISKEIDQIIIVVKAGHTDSTAFNHTVTSLRNVNAPLGGIILNAVTSKNSYGSYYYYYQYYHYYGSEENSKNA